VKVFFSERLILEGCTIKQTILFSATISPPKKKGQQFDFILVIWPNRI